jgi:hypothetical protein
LKRLPVKKNNNTAEPGWVAVAVLLALSLLIVLERLHTYHEPLYTNLVCYASFGKELLEGKILYRDLWDHKPPGIFATYAVAEAVLGSGRFVIYFLSVIAGIIGMLGVYRAVRFMIGGALPALAAAGLWALVSGDLRLEANQPDMEVFINAFLIWAFALWVEKEGNCSRNRAVCVGLLWGAASLYKHYVVVDALFLSATLLIAGNSKDKTMHWRVVSWALGTVAGVWLLVFGYFSLTNRFQMFWEALFSFNIYYSGDMSVNITSGLSALRLCPDFMLWLLPFEILVVFGFFMGYRTRKIRWLLLGAFCAAKYIEVVLPGRFTTHYYQLWLPAIVVGFGWALSVFEKRWNRRVMIATAVLLIGWAGVHEAKWYRLSEMESSRVKYGLDYESVSSVVETVQKVLQPEETFYEWSDVPRFYYDAGCRLPTKYLFNFLMFRGPLTEKMAQQTIEDLGKTIPELVIFDRNWRPQGWENQRVTVYLRERYKPFKVIGSLGRFELCYRVGGNLEKRLGK